MSTWAMASRGGIDGSITIGWLPSRYGCRGLVRVIEKPASSPLRAASRRSSPGRGLGVAGVWVSTRPKPIAKAQTKTMMAVGRRRRRLRITSIARVSRRLSENHAATPSARAGRAAGETKIRRDAAGVKHSDPGARSSKSGAVSSAGPHADDLVYDNTGGALCEDGTRHFNGHEGRRPAGGASFQKRYPSGSRGGGSGDRTVPHPAPAFGR